MEEAPRQFSEAGLSPEKKGKREPIPMSSIDNFVCERVKVLREERGWSLTDMAIALDTTPTQIRKHETGDLRISLSWMYRFAKALGVKLTALLPPDEADFSADPATKDLLEAFYGIPEDDRKSVLQAARIMSTVARNIATSVLPGDAKIAMAMAEKWGGWTDRQRAEAVNLFSVIDKI